MWGLDNRTVYEAERGWILDRDGAKHWVVVVKGTFDIRPDGSLTLSDDPVPPFLAPEYFGEDGASSVRYEADIVGAKAATDVTVNGSAHAPGGKPVTQMHVALQVGGLRKIIEVVGDRQFERGLAGQVVPGSPSPFVTMPIVYERAYGGFDPSDPEPSRQRMDERNPVGRGCAARARSLLGTPVANLSIPGETLGDGPPAGFGAIASYWSPRRRYAGTYDARWVEQRKPLLPADFDPRYYQHAPSDQQLSPPLRGTELVEVVNMSPRGPLRFALPKIYIALTTHFGFETKQHRATLASVIVEPEFPRVVMVWQSTLPAHHLVDRLDKTVVRERPYR